MKVDKRIWMTLLLTFVVALAGCADEEAGEGEGEAVEESTATQDASPAPVTDGATTTTAHDAPASSGFALIE